MEQAVGAAAGWLRHSCPQMPTTKDSTGSEADATLAWGQGKECRLWLTEERKSGHLGKAMARQQHGKCQSDSSLGGLRTFIKSRASRNYRDTEGKDHLVEALFSVESDGDQVGLGMGMHQREPRIFHILVLIDFRTSHYLLGLFHYHEKRDIFPVLPLPGLL